MISRRLHVSIFLPVLLSGCAYELKPETMFYPPEWAPLRSNVRCEDFAGVYRVDGENAQRSPYGVNNPKLSGLLGLVSSKDAIAYVRIESAHEGEAIALAALDSAREPIPAVAVERIVCHDGNWVQHSQGSGYADGSSHRSETSTTISLARDGSLVAHVVGVAHTDDFLSHATRRFDVLYRFGRYR